jgi:HD-GYP domain-containing protein (c-di-GMP phosphodiesterase class II)
MSGGNEKKRMQAPIRLSHPVHTHGGRELVPAGTELTAGLLEDLATAGAKRNWPEIRMLDYGTVRRDMKRQMALGGYRHIFHDAVPGGDIEKLVGEARFPLPILEGLAYFKENDFYTYRHILMVYALSCLLSSRMSDGSRRICAEAAAGPLHDMGKACIPLSILKKDSPLLRSEKNILEQHSAAGYVLLSYYLGEAEALSAYVARDHHERRDGSGYPRGISLADRHVEIISVCDIYDALTTPRPYRRGSYDNRTALEEITRLAEGGKVGWEIVNHLVALCRQDHPHPDKCEVSLEKRGTPPVERLYGVIVEDGEEESA